MYNNNNYPSIDVIRSKMDQVMVPELSLGPSMSVDQKSTSSSLTSSDQSTFDQTARYLKKRKSFNDHIVQSNKAVVLTGSSLDDLFLRNDHQVKRDRLPPDWEQCLDLKLGKMYFLNRKTAEKRWDRPNTTDNHDQNNEKPVLELELELNISSPTSSHSNSNFKASQKTIQNNEHKQPSVKAVNHDANISTTTTTPTTTTRGIGSNNMVALACNNCHLLVILSKSSPSCPNCKYVHYLHSNHDQQLDFKESPNPNLKPISTLTLFS